MDAYLFDGLLLASCVFAGFYGGTPERMGAAMMVIASNLSFWLVSRQGTFQDVEWGVFLVDCGLLVGLLALALYANRYWPMWVTSMQFVTVWSHLGFLSVASKLPWAYAVASTIWSFPMLIILAWGTVRHRRRMHRYQMDDPWAA